MKLVYSVVDSGYNANTGESYVVINTPIGTFKGSTQLHEEDKDIKSAFQGCYYAESRALIKYYKELIKIQKVKCNTLKTLITDLQAMKDYQAQSVEARRIRKEYFIQKDILEKYEVILNSIKSCLYEKMKNYREKYELQIKRIEERLKKPTIDKE